MKSSVGKAFQSLPETAQSLLTGFAPPQHPFCFCSRSCQEIHTPQEGIFLTAVLELPFFSGSASKKLYFLSNCNVIVHKLGPEMFSQLPCPFSQFFTACFLNADFKRHSREFVTQCKGQISHRDLRVNRGWLNLHHFHSSVPSWWPSSKFQKMYCKFSEKSTLKFFLMISHQNISEVLGSHTLLSTHFWYLSRLVGRWQHHPYISNIS